MAEREIDIKGPGTSTAVRMDKVSTIDKEAYRARMARVMDRGITIDRLHVDLPPDVHGEWFANDDVSIARAELLGFQHDTEYSVRKSLHDGGEATSRVGDVVFMVQPKWMKEIRDEERNKRYAENHLRNRRKMKEEEDFQSQTNSIGMPSTVKSDTEVVDGPSIEQALKTPVT